MLLKKICYLFLIVFVISCSKDAPIEEITENNNADLPKFTIEKVNNPTEGEILLAPYTHGDANSGHILVLDKEGKVLKHKKMPKEALDFKRWNINGITRYSYVEHEHGSVQMPGVIFIPGPVVLLDENLNEIKRIRLLPHNGRTAADKDALDGHDFILLDDNHYLVMAYYEKAVNNIPSDLNPLPDAKVAAAIIQEVKNGQVIWEWQSTDYPEFYSSSVEGNKFSSADETDDYVHINSFFIDPRDNNLIVSFRHTDQIVKLNRQNGNIIWRLGGKNSDFPLTGEQRFYRQHHATLADNNQTLLIYDNGSAKDRSFTRIIEFQLDEGSKSVTGFKAMHAPDNIFSGFMGSVQKRGNTYFAGWGSEPRITEMDATTGEIRFDMKMEKYTYRAYKY